MSKTRLPRMRYQMIKAFLLIVAFAVLFPILCEWHCQLSG
jgi:hypothetical protein